MKTLALAALLALCLVGCKWKQAKESAHATYIEELVFTGNRFYNASYLVSPENPIWLGNSRLAITRVGLDIGSPKERLLGYWWFSGIVDDPKSYIKPKLIPCDDEQGSSIPPGGWKLCELDQITNLYHNDPSYDWSKKQ